MELLRKSVTASAVTEFKFDVKSYDFLVKNLTGDDILVCFNEFDENANIKIPTMMSQIITQNVVNKKSSYATDTIQVKSSGEGEVEIQCLTY